MLDGGEKKMRIKTWYLVVFVLIILISSSSFATAVDDSLSSDSLVPDDSVSSEVEEETQAASGNDFESSKQIADDSASDDVEDDSSADDVSGEEDTDTDDDSSLDDGDDIVSDEEDDSGSSVVSDSGDDSNNDYELDDSDSENNDIPDDSDDDISDDDYSDTSEDNSQSSTTTNEEIITYLNKFCDGTKFEVVLNKIGFGIVPTDDPDWDINPDPPDSDGDGIPNEDDNCPFNYNPGQEDADGDGIGDACDSCTDCDNDGYCSEINDCNDNDASIHPGATEECDGVDNDCDGQVDEGCEQDSDSDGIPDDEDNCPEIYNPDQTDTDGDGKGDKCDSDDDGDGIPDSYDNCPLVSNPGQEDSDGDGIGDACDDVNEYKLTVSVAEGNGSINVNPTSSDNYYIEGTSITLTALPDEDDGWYFNEWRGDVTGKASQTTFQIYKHMNVFAYFSKDSNDEGYNVNYVIVPDGVGFVATDPPGGFYDDGQIVTLTAHVRPEYESEYNFDHWSGALSGTSNPAPLTMNSDKTVTAHFKTKEDDSSSTEANNQNNIIDTITQVNSGSSVSTEITNYNSFQSSFSLSEINSNLFVSLNLYRMYILNGQNDPQTNDFGFGGDYTLTTICHGNGSVNRNPPKYRFDSGETCVLTAVPLSGNKFDRWGGALSGSSNPKTITINGDTVVHAYFAKKTGKGSSTYSQSISGSNANMVIEQFITGSNTFVGGLASLNLGDSYNTMENNYY